MTDCPSQIHVCFTDGFIESIHLNCDCAQKLDKGNQFNLSLFHLIEYFDKAMFLLIKSNVTGSC